MQPRLPLATAPARPSKQSPEGTESQTTTTTTPPPRQMSCRFTPLLAILDLEKMELWQLEMAPKKKLTKERWNLKVSNLITSQSQPTHHAKSPARNRPVRWNPSLAFHLAPCFSSGLGLTSTSHTSWRPNRVQGYCKKYMPTKTNEI